MVLPSGFQTKHYMPLPCILLAPPPPTHIQERSDKSVVAVVLGDNWHPPQYAVKAEKILLLCFQEELVSSLDLFYIWNRLKHERVSVVKNTHRLLAKMVCDLEDTKQLDAYVQVKGRGEGKGIENANGAYIHT